MVGCAQPTLDKVQQTVKKQASLLVDSGLIVNKYVILYELAINDSNHIYQIQASDCPAWGFDYPSKIVQYKDRIGRIPNVCRRNDRTDRLLR